METMKYWNLIIRRDLVYADKWESAEFSVKAFVFGELFKLAQGKMKRYESDLFHDANWINKYLTGPCQFDWVLRESGTHIGQDVAFLVSDWNMFSDVLGVYRFEIILDDVKFVLNIYQAKDN